ncbi:MAG: hypothetical protein RL213_1557 [Bacteroidota bacterium]|jgi:hypothetical protein
MSDPKILSLLTEKVALKQSVSAVTQAAFNELKRTLKELFEELHAEVKKSGKNVPMEYRERSDYQVEIMIADDYIVFLMQTNVFTFDGDHEVWKMSYVKEDPGRSFVGKIYVYNFLSDSFTFNRPNDVGYLIARLFVNKDNHYFVEGQRQLGFLYNDFGNAVLDKEAIRKVVESTILYSLDFDSFTPPYEKIQVISVGEVQETSLQAKIATGKRLGFRFQADTGRI